MSASTRHITTEIIFIPEKIVETIVIAKVHLIRASEKYEWDRPPSIQPQVYPHPAQVASPDMQASELSSIFEFVFPSHIFSSAKYKWMCSPHE